MVIVIYGELIRRMNVERLSQVEKLMDHHNLILLNDSVHTRFDTYHQTSSLLDLSLWHPSIYMDVVCEISSDRLGSDHIPSLSPQIHLIIQCPKEFQNGINFKKAKWNAFQDQCIAEITPNLSNDAEDKMAISSSTLLDIAVDNIPKPLHFQKEKPNLGLMKIVKQLKRKEIKLID